MNVSFHALRSRAGLLAALFAIVSLHPGSPSACPHLIGKVPHGPCWAVASSGDYAYFSSGAVLMIADITDPSAPIVVGQLELPADIDGIEISNGYAYLACGSRGLWVVDVTDSTTPVVAGAYTSTLWPVSLEVVGDLAYVANAANPESLVVLDVSDPASIAKLGSVWGLLVSVYDITVAGSHAYLVGYEDGLKIVDVSDPTTPTLVGESPAFHGVGVSVHDGHAYAVEFDTEPTSGFRVFDVSNPSAPVQTAFVPHPWLSDVAVVGSIAYLSSGSLLESYDITDPSTPVAIGSLSMSAFRLDASVQHIYAAGFEDGLQIVDVTDPSSPIVVGAFDTPGYTKSIDATGSLVFADGGNEGVRIFDASNPHSPVEIATTGGPNGAWDLTVSGDFLYAATSSRLEIFDIANPVSPIQLSSIHNGAMGVAIRGDYAYVASSLYGNGSLITIDVGDPTSPITRGTAALPDGARTVAVEGAHAYVTVLNDGLRIVNVTSPTNPVVVGHFPGTGVSDAAVADGYAYVGASDGLHIVDVTNPSFPVEAGLYSVNSVSSVDVAGRYAYVGVGDSGLHALDIDDPTQPILVGVLSPTDKAGMAEQIRVVGDMVYAAHWTDGWSVSLGCHALFVDGFESADASAWSLTMP